MLDKFYACLYLSITLVLIWRKYGLVYVQLLANCLNQSDTKFILLWIGHKLIIHQHSSWPGTCCNNLQYTTMFHYLSKIYLHQLLPTACSELMWYCFSCGCVCWQSRHVAQCFTVFSIPAFMFKQYNDECTNSLIFFYSHVVAMQLLQYLLLYLERVIVCLHFITMPSIIANLFPITQYCLLLWSTSSFFYCQPCIIYTFSSWRCAPINVVVCMSCMDVHTSMFTEVFMAFMFTLISTISWSLFSAWLLWGSHSMMYKSGPGLSIMYTLYWCIYSIMHCNHCDSVATSLLSIDY